MTLPKKARDFHQTQLKVAGVKLVQFYRNNYAVVVVDAMKGLYSLHYRETWDDIALQFYKNFR